MDPQDKRLKEALYGAAVEIDDPEAMEAFMDVLARGSPDLSRWLGDTVSAAREADRFVRSLEEARTLAVLDTGAELIEAGPMASDDDGQRSGGEDRIGQWIGRYQLLERLGEGGCGVVYLAGQKEPVDRKVALKVIRLGMDTERVIARFEAERQSLAMMEHPNIARVLDAGATGSGRPFFVMERVTGPPITRYCDEHRLGLRERIELFIAVCSGIQHAHQKGVLHRDIKPSNILVAVTDGKAAPKVIDFGIAKAIEEDVGIGTALTMNDAFAGTPAYMSPEQADLNARDVDTRSDVYGLGVLLYELLTGSTPFDPARLAASGLREMRRILVEEEPPGPSAMLAALPAERHREVAAHRRLEPARLVSEIRGDLDSVVMKAMEKERRRRYETVNGLIMDLQRYLDCEPVLARPQGRLYLAGKFVRRNRLAVGAATGAITSICLGLGVASVSYLKERRSKEEQARLRQIAEAAHASERQQLAEARDWENMAQISMLLSAGQIEEADEKLRSTPLESMKITPQSAGALRSLGNWNSIQGRWPQAAECFKLLLVANEMGSTHGLASTDILTASASMVESGHAEDYDFLRRWTLRQFDHNSDEVTVERVLQATLLTPADDAFLLQLVPFKQRLEMAEFDPKRLRSGWISVAAVWQAWAVAMYEYRSGRPAEAKVWIEKALKIPGQPKYMPGILHPVLAMAEFRLGNRAAAGVSLEQAKAAIDAAFAPELPAAYEPMGKHQGAWWDWIAARILYREACGLIGDAGGR